MWGNSSSGALLTSIVCFFPTMESMMPQNIRSNFFEYLPLCSAEQTFTQVWNYLRVSKDKFHFWVNYPFNLEESGIVLFLQKKKICTAFHLAVIYYI